ncbi:unnamed protein product [Cochlearia groenlandica]
MKRRRSLSLSKLCNFLRRRRRNTNNDLSSSLCLLEYEKSSSTAFSRKMSNRSHSHNLTFNTNAIYDGVFASQSKSRSPMFDFGEIF